MAVFRDTLIGLLWDEVNAGRMPVKIRMCYQMYQTAMVVDKDFHDEVVLGIEYSSFQSLPINFDKSVKIVIIDTDPPKAEPKPETKGVWK